jgi:hypothetical protein
MNFEIAPKSTEIQSNWFDAKLYCFSFNIDGKVGWRLPTIEELVAIYKSEHDFNNYWYWSSTEYDDKYVWFQGTGDKGYTRKDDAYGWVRAVRDLS